MRFYPKYSESIGALKMQSVINRLFQDWKTRNGDYGLILTDTNSIVLNVRNIFRQYIGVQAYIFCLDDRTIVDTKANNWSIIFPLAPMIISIYAIIDSYNKSNGIMNEDNQYILISMFLVGAMFYSIQLIQYKVSKNKLINRLENIIKESLSQSK